MNQNILQATAGYGLIGSYTARRLVYIIPRVAKCHGYDGYIRVKIFRGWGKKSKRIHNVTKLGLF